MILADTSVWVDHFRAGDSTLAQLLDSSLIVLHAFVIGELAMGSFRNRERVLKNLRQLPEMMPARHSEVMAMVDRTRLFGHGIGFVDAHLLTSIRLRPGMKLWTRDRRLQQIAADLGFSAGLA